MFNLYNKIEELCHQKGIRIAELSRATGINKTVFSELKQGRTKFLSTERLILVADYFEISLDELVGKEKTTDADAPMVGLFSGRTEVTDEMWEEVANFARFIEEREAKKRGEM